MLNNVFMLVDLVNVEWFVAIASHDGFVQRQVEGHEALDEEILRRVAVLGHAASVLAVHAVCSRPLQSQFMSMILDTSQYYTVIERYWDCDTTQ